jgi:hypothetical protein
LQRLPIGTTYPAIVAHVGRIMSQLPAGTELIIDETGVGRPVADLFVYSGISPVRVQITAGTAETREGVRYFVPKLVLVSRLQALLHQGLLKIKKSLPEAEVLVRELQDFRVQYTATGNLTFNAREGRHDDLVLAVAVACWRAYGDAMPFAGLFEYYRSRATGMRSALPSYFVGLDLGQSRDPTAIAIVKKIERPTRLDLLTGEYAKSAAEAAA